MKHVKLFEQFLNEASVLDRNSMMGWITAYIDGPRTMVRCRHSNDLASLI